MHPRYEDDFYGWTQEQAAMLRAGKLDKLDIENLLEEVETMGRSEHRTLISCLRILLAHLLKWKYQPKRRNRSWKLTIINQRDAVPDYLAASPSLKHKLEEHIELAYRKAIILAVGETDLNKNTFPKTCPWTFEQIIDNDFYPTQE